MKKLLLLLLLPLLASCQRLLEEDLWELEDMKEMMVVTRSTSGISYPLTLYAFSSNEGRLVGTATASSASESLLLHLPNGNYRLVVIAGSEDCIIPEAPILTSSLVLPESNRITQPLQMGSADIYVTKNATANITLYNQVAALALSLTDIPEDVTAVNVGLSSLYTMLAFDGTMQGSGTTTVGLSKQDDGSWSTPLFYTLPGSSSKLVLSITTESPTGKQTYGYTHSATLESNTPYTLTGSYSEGFAVNGSITLAGWNTAKDIIFSFGANISGEQDEDENESDNLETVTVNSIPSAGKIWNNHFIAAMQDVTSTSAELLLLSQKEWTGVTSATHEQTPDMAKDFVNTYKEDGLGGWHIPTRDEAKLMRTTIGLEALEKTNSVLSANAISPLATGEDDAGEKIRYLCDDATYTFAWDNTTVSKVGTKRTYHMRVVKRLKVVKK